MNIYRSCEYRRTCQIRQFWAGERFQLSVYFAQRYWGVLVAQAAQSRLPTLGTECSSASQYRVYIYIGPTRAAPRVHPGYSSGASNGAVRDRYKCSASNKHQSQHRNKCAGLGHSRSGRFPHFFFHHVPAASPTRPFGGCFGAARADTPLGSPRSFRSEPGLSGHVLEQIYTLHTRAVHHCTTPPPPE